MKRFALIPINRDEDRETANRKSWLRRRRLSKGLSIGDDSDKSQAATWWQTLGHYDHEVEVVYDRHGHYITQRYTGRTRCAG